MTDRCVSVDRIGLPDADPEVAALAGGLAPGMGVPPADLKARESLACDLMEPVRRQVDGLVLNLSQTHTFAVRDFFETRQGACRLMPAVTAQIAERAPTLAKWIGPVAEDVAQALFRPEHRTAKRDRALPTLLTQENRRTGREGVRARAKQAKPESRAILPAACPDCGTILPDQIRQYCDGCLPERRKESVAAFSVAGPLALAQLRTEGRNPAHGGDAGRKRGQRNAQHISEAARWESEHGGETDPAEFHERILPHLQDVPLSAIMEATGLSLRYCSVIRRGIDIPHPRHWEALAQLSKESYRYQNASLA